MKALMIAACAALTFVCAACYPIVVKPECQLRVDECLKACPSSPSDQVYDYGRTSPIDTRSDCQRHCHEMCAQGIM
jgi:hypothetical protein